MTMFQEIASRSFGRASTEGMVAVEAGRFLMGSATGAAFERPVHEVHVGRFWIDTDLVTNSRFAAFVEATGHVTDAERRGEAWGCRGGEFSTIPGLSWRSYSTAKRGEHPVVLVSWFDAQAYAHWVGKSLPTEAEWEKAARSGSLGAAYPWGSAEPDGRQANFASRAIDFPGTTAIRTFAPSALGLFDLSGNVWQWCQDWYGEDYYSSGEKRNPLGPSRGTTRVRRGGAWNVVQSFRLRSANRGALDPAQAMPNTGFRCVLRGQGNSLPVLRVSGAAASPLANDSPSGDDGPRTARASAVAEVLEALRPAMRADGGDVRLLGVDGGVVKVLLVGTCESCPSSELTMREGIERTLRHHLPWVTAVVRQTRTRS